MNIRRGTAQGIAVSLAVIALGAAGCSSSSSSADAPKGVDHGSSSSSNAQSGGQQLSDADLVAAAYTKTTAANTAKVSLTGDISGVRISGSGVVDFANKKSDIMLSTPQGPVETRTLNGVTYTKLPAAASSLLKGKQWLKISTGSGAGGIGGSTPQPGDILSYLQGLSSSVKKVGTAEVRGTQTTHYTATIDLDKVAAKATTTQAKKAIETLEQRSGVHSLPIQVWIDDSGLLRRVQTSVPVKTGASGQVTEDLYDFGTSVNVVAPPASQVTDAGALGGSLGGN